MKDLMALSKNVKFSRTVPLRLMPDKGQGHDSERDTDDSYMVQRTQITIWTREAVYVTRKPRKKIQDSLQRDPDHYPLLSPTCGCQIMSKPKLGHADVNEVHVCYEDLHSNEVWTEPLVSFFLRNTVQRKYGSAKSPADHTYVVEHKDEVVSMARFRVEQMSRSTVKQSNKAACTKRYHCS